MSTEILSELEDLKGIVTVKPFRRNYWLPEGHEGEYRFAHCIDEQRVFVDSKTKLYITGLTEEEEEYFEAKMHLEPGTLSRYNKEYWAKYKIPVKRDGLELDLSLYSDKLMYKVLLAHRAFANSEAEKYDTPDADYVLTSPEQEAKVNNARNKVERRANKIFYNMSTEEMTNFLKVYGKGINRDTTIDMIETTVDSIIKEDPKGFLEIVEDADFDIKLLISDCISNKLLRKHGAKYMLIGGETIGLSLEDAVKYLKDPNNNDVLISLKGRLEVK